MTQERHQRTMTECYCDLLVIPAQAGIQESQSLGTCLRR